MPDSHSLVCPQCKARYKTTGVTSGKRVRCRHCGHVWRDERHTLPGLAGALDKAASAWSQLGSTTIEHADHASTMGHLASQSVPVPKPPPGEWIGRRLGRYEVKAVLGQGAMGYVYEALDTDLKRTVAIKLLPRQIEGEKTAGLRMFLQEAQVAAKLQHPNIVTIYEIGHENGYHFFAMERVQGTTLHGLVHEYGALPASQACYVIAHTARALAAGHAMGIVHRDVKPGNIMVDENGQVKVTDFGLAEVHGVEHVRELSGRAMGTPGWISPEVARGERATPASDIYGLGLTLYYALTKKRLIRAETKSGMIRHQRTAKSIRREQLPHDWPSRLRDIVVQCLQADPKDRYQSADTLAADLLRALIPQDSDATLVLDHKHDAPPRFVSPVIGWSVLGLVMLIAVLLACWYYFLR
ncbi:MAG: protein kinase [Phycisphaerales bacterium]|nr:protein kinase [Phycisphaerales bacterium]